MFTLARDDAWTEQDQIFLMNSKPGLHFIGDFVSIYETQVKKNIHFHKMQHNTRIFLFVYASILSNLQNMLVYVSVLHNYFY